MKCRYTVHVFMFFLCVCLAISACSGASPESQVYTTSLDTYVCETSYPDIPSDSSDNATTEVADEPNLTEMAPAETSASDITAHSAASDDVSSESIHEGKTSFDVQSLSSSAEVSDVTVQEDDSETTSSVPEISVSSYMEPVSEILESQTMTMTTSAKSSSGPKSVSPPIINKPTSPGKNVFKAENTVFDHSNSSEGYVSVKYTGKTRLKMLLTNSDSRYDYDIYPENAPQYYALSQGDGEYTVEIYEMVTGGKFIMLIKDKFTVKVSDRIKMYTYTNRFANFDKNSACTKKASEICAGCSGDLEKIAAVFGYVTDNVSYDKVFAANVSSGYIPDPDRTLASGKGICFDYASITASMLRSQGIPVRIVIGFAKPDIYHAWNEVYTTEKGWITAEINLSNKGFNRIDATFYASAKNKKACADFVADSGNYSQVYVY